MASIENKFKTKKHCNDCDGEAEVDVHIGEAHAFGGYKLIVTVNNNTPKLVRISKKLAEQLMYEGMGAEG